MAEGFEERISFIVPLKVAILAAFLYYFVLSIDRRFSDPDSAGVSLERGKERMVQKYLQQATGSAKNRQISLTPSDDPDLYKAYSMGRPFLAAGLAEVRTAGGDHHAVQPDRRATPHIKEALENNEYFKAMTSLTWDHSERTF
ncbi:hypothetical protein [Paenibacillus sp. FSL W7-1332]|uniref:hypothetical protein n=1 Tax=Paenibacillus sp. FSL W7-1332 TaxID=2921702 RepID=UPI0030CE6873